MAKNLNFVIKLERIHIESTINDGYSYTSLSNRKGKFFNQRESHGITDSYTTEILTKAYQLYLKQLKTVDTEKTIKRTIRHEIKSYTEEVTVVKENPIMKYYQNRSYSAQPKLLQYEEILEVFVFARD